MNIATGAMDALLPKLTDLVKGGYDLQNGVKGEIKALEEELKYMDAALHKVSKVQADQLDEQVKIWASDVRELSYDIEDAVDTFMLQIKGHEPGESFTFKGLIARTINLLKNGIANHKIHNVIKDILDQVKKLNERHVRYKVDVVASPSTVIVDPRLEAIYKQATDLVGIEGPKNELAQKLIDEGSSTGQHPKIISIVGFGGLGKTTLANALFRDLKSKFDCHAFVSVSLYPDIKMILRNILSQLDKSERINEAWDLMQLINVIREILESKRCLCVIDDVWNESAWDPIKLALQDAKHGSKIIITTRKKNVAEYAGGDVYELRPLSHDDSRKLLNMRVFDSEDGCPLGLREVSKKILEKCGGVPLAIITIASLLASKPVHSSVEWEKINNSIGSALEKSHDVDKMRKILLLSYNDLPFHLKTCFLYLGLFPEDTVIDKDSLISSWIGEGFIVEETRPAGTTLWDIGESYFNELINRSLIQPVNGIWIRCRCTVHDMVLDLINQLSAEEGFSTTLLPDGQQTDTRASAAKTKQIRRLSLHNFNRSHSYSREAIEQWSKLRSLIVFRKVDSTLSLSSFQVLRVLRLEGCRHLYDNCLDDICKLRHLRFLQLLGLCDPIPESIGKLESLETLEITNYERTKLIMPMSFVKLQKLVRLIVHGVDLPLGLPLGDMKSLQVLNGIKVCDPKVFKVIGNLKSLSVLRIELFFFDTVVEGASDLVAYIFMCLQRCANFKELDIDGWGSISCSSDYMPHVSSGLQRFSCLKVSTAFPGWINSSTLSCLTDLTIELRLAPQPEHLEKLAELPSLRSLRLYYNIFDQRHHKVIITSGGFGCLEYLGIEVESVFHVFQPGAMPELRRLHLWSFRKNETIIPSGLENLRFLRHVIIGDQVDADDVREALKDNPNRPTLEQTDEVFFKVL